MLQPPPEKAGVAFDQTRPRTRASKSGFENAFRKFEGRRRGGLCRVYVLGNLNR